MLKELYVKHFVLIDEVRIAFAHGLTIITGETGAGKSVLLGALAQVLGGRADTDLIMHTANRATIEAVFTCDEVGMAHWLEAEYGIDLDGGLLILRRQITKEGRSRCFLNGLTVPLATIKKIGSRLVDIHGQHQHQALLDEACHGDFLDHFGGYTTLLQDVKDVYQKVHNVTTQLTALKSSVAEQDERQELYAFQYQELVDADLHEGEYDELQIELLRLENAENLSCLAEDISEKVSQNDDALVVHLGAVERMIDELLLLDPSLHELQEYCEGARVNLEELADATQRYSGSIVIDPTRLEEVRERNQVLERIMKKFGGTEITALARRDSLEKKSLSNEDTVFAITKLELELEKEKKDLVNNCAVLSQARKKAAQRLTKKVIAELHSVGMLDVQFSTAVTLRKSALGQLEVEGTRVQVGSCGYDDTAFLIAANPGQPLRPLAKVASGGEISRIMLVLKDLLAEGDKVPTMVFDEIDVGISGRIAQVVGERIGLLGRRRQVVCITHLPQIASYANQHLSVRKIRSGNRAVIKIIPLSADEREQEIAALLDGRDTGETSLNHARELIRRSCVQ